MKNPLQLFAGDFFENFETMGSDPDVSFLTTLQVFLHVLKQWGQTPMFHFWPLCRFFCKF